MANLDAEEERKRQLLASLASGPERWKAATLSPEDLKQLELGQSQFSGIQSDPAMRQAQLDSINSLKDISDRGGRSLQEDADLNRIKFDANQDASRRDQDILQSMAARGQSGGGAELAARLQNASSAAQRESQASMDTAASGEQRSLAALQQRGVQAGSLDNADYKKAADAAAANDQIQKFNQDTARGFATANQNAQNVANSQNAGAANKWTMDSTKLGYDDAVQSENRKILEEQERQRQKAQKRSGIGSALGAAAGGAAGWFAGGGFPGATAGAQAGSQLGGTIFSDERLKENKEDVPHEDVDAFLSSIDPKKFDYKKPVRAVGDVLQAQQGGEQEVRDAFKNLAQRGLRAGSAQIDPSMNSLHQSMRGEVQGTAEAGNALRGLAKDAYQGGIDWVKKLAHPDEPSNIGVMAQDIEKTPMGKQIVIDTPEGKQLDSNAMLGAVMAALKRLDQKKENKAP